MLGLIFVGTISFGASAFTAATIDRQATVDVVADENGLLALIDGNSGNLVFQNGSTEQLGIGFTNTNADGVNVNAKFELGNPDDPTSSNAFKIKNRDDEQHQVNVAYTDANTNSEENLKITIYDGGGNRVGSVTEEGTTASFTTPPSNMFYVVVTIDTGGGSAGDLTSASDLSGTVSFIINDTNVGGTNSDKSGGAPTSTPTDSTKETSNIINNPTFVAGSETDANFWEQDDTAGGAVRATDRALVGDYSMRQEEFTSGYSREFISDPVDVSAGEEYQFGGSYYLESTDDNPTDYDYYITVRWLDGEGNELDRVPSSATGGSEFQTFDKWTETNIKSAPHTAPENAEQAELRVRSRDNGNEDTDVYWDDLFLEKTED